MQINNLLLNESFTNAKISLGIPNTTRRLPLYNDDQIKQVISTVWDNSVLEQQSTAVERVAINFLTTLIVDRFYNGPVVTDINALNIDLGDFFRKLIERIKKY